MPDAAPWRRRAIIAVALLLHAPLIWLAETSANDPSEPVPDVPVPVIVTPPAPVRVSPPARPAKPGSPRLELQPMPRLVWAPPPPVRLAPPVPLLSKPPMSVSVAPRPPAPAGSGSGPEAGSDPDGTVAKDYLERLHAYVDQRQRRFNRGGKPLDDAVIAILLDKDGALIRAVILTSSGQKQVDNQVLEQLRSMSPFPKPPPEMFPSSKAILAVATPWLFGSRSLRDGE